MKHSVTTSILPKAAGAFLAFCLLSLFPPSLEAQEQSYPKPGPEQRRLAISTGKWTYQGTEVETPLGVKGDFKGRTTIRMRSNGFVLERHSVEKTGDWLSLVWYDGEKKSYVGMSFTPSGAVDTGKVIIDGNTWMSTGELRDKSGKVWKTRDTTTFSPDGRTSTGRQEYSPDDGKTWLLWYTMSSKKTGK